MPHHAMLYKPIDGYNGRYLVNQSGEIVHVWKKGFQRMKTVVKRNGSEAIRLTDAGGQRHEHKVSRIVAQAFLPAPRAGLSLKHINGVKTDNHVGNLEWVTKRQLGKLTGAEAKRRPVCKIDQDGNAVAFYASARAAAKENHMSYQAVLDRCNGKVKRPFALDGHNYQFDKECAE